jgi:hypothetical protein
MVTRAWFVLAIAALVGACGGGGGTSATTADTPITSLPAAQINLLFMGNSHTSANDLPGMVAAMVRAARPSRTVAKLEAPGWLFLEARARDAESLRILREGRWDFVVLQAQEYSSSGDFTYPIDGAVALVRMSRDAHATPILFPEWPRRGIDETQRIYDLHVSIARTAAACVAPIPQAWDLALSRHPDLVLYASDGNHSAPAGAFLAALVIANTMTGFAPDHLPFLPDLGVDADTQARLRAVAAQTVISVPPRQWCPADPDPLPSVLAD